MKRRTTRGGQGQARAAAWLAATSLLALWVHSPTLHAQAPGEADAGAPGEGVAPPGMSAAEIMEQMGAGEGDTPAPAPTEAQGEAASEEAATPPGSEAPSATGETEAGADDAPPASQSASQPTAAPAAPPAAAGPARSPPPSAAELVVVEAFPIGVDPIVGRYVTQQMRRTGSQLGYRLESVEDTTGNVRRLRMPYPPSLADLWRLTYVAEAQRGVFARVWAEAGRYVIEVQVASIDGAGPFRARGTSGAADLQTVVDRLVREALPPPSAEPLRPPEPTTKAPRQPSEDAFQAPPRRRPRPRAGGGPRRWILSVQTEAAFGVSDDFFYNHLAGVRMEYRFSAPSSLGLYLGYSNLRGRNGRTHNLLPYAQFQHQVRVAPRSSFRIPLRVALGYLPRNGPVLRFATGIAYPITRYTDLVIDLVAPTFWITPDRTLFSLDFAVEIAFKL